MPAIWNRTTVGPKKSRQLDVSPQAPAVFASLEEYRGALTSITGQMRTVRTAWSHLELAEGEEALQTIQERVDGLQVPRGCERAQRALLDAVDSYRTALEQLNQAKRGDSPAEFSAAWGLIAHGDVLLSLAMRLAGE